MDWIEIAIRTTTEGADSVAQLLMDAGSAGASIEDRADIAALQRPEGHWDMIDEGILQRMEPCVVVRGYLPEGANARDALAQLTQRLRELRELELPFDMGELSLSFVNVHEEDWADNWKKYYKPFRAGEKLVVKPTWEPYERQSGDIVLELDPGMAFGTGTHETTALCLAMLERYATPGEYAIDVGTGSGILSIAAVRLGMRAALAIDLDEVAVRVARDNVRVNGLESEIDVRQGDLLAQVTDTADLVIANIIADVICALASPVRARLREGGVFLCSGIIKDREPDVVEALTGAGYTLIETRYMGEWLAIAARRGCA